MTVKSTIIFGLIIMAFSACNTRCVRCSAYYAYNDTILADKTWNIKKPAAKLILMPMSRGRILPIATIRRLCLNASRSQLST